MKLPWASSLVFVLAAAASAQHGSTAGHPPAGRPATSVPSSGRSFSAPTTHTPSHAYGSAPAYRPNPETQPHTVYTSPIGAAPFGGTQPYNSRRYPNGVYRPSYARAVYAVPGWLSYGYGYAGDADSDAYSNDQPQGVPAASEANAQIALPDEGYDPAYGQAPPRSLYAQQTSLAPPSAPAAPAELPEQPEVTLLFKDGRPPLLVQNYAITRTTLYVLDGQRRREISLDQIDLPQTERTNRDAGIDFDVPVIAD